MMNNAATRRLGRTVLAFVLAVGGAQSAQAFCGCDKPPPPRANIRPFVSYADQMVTLFDDRLVPGSRYTVQFTSLDGSDDWSRGRAALKRDFADGEYRRQMRVSVPSLPLGPAAINVYDGGQLLYSLGADEFTVMAAPIALHDFSETLTRDGYQTGVSMDGTVFFAFDLSGMSDATTYSGVAVGYPLRFDGSNIAIFNSQGVLGEMLASRNTSPGLFRITSGGMASSSALDYWRHEFRTYKEDHRKRDERRIVDGEWHSDGTRHIDNYHLVVAIAGTMPNGDKPGPGATPPFRLVVSATPSPSSPLR
jgi:hypothetical protein